MKNKKNLLVTFLSIFYLITISNADTGFGISAVGTLSSITVGGIEEKNTTPVEYSLNQNYPNPFNPSTTIEFSIPKTELVTLKIYNLLGQEVATLVSEKLNTGSYNYSWNAASLASGVYIYKIQAGVFQHVRKMVYLK